MKNEEKTQIKTGESQDVVHSVDESRRSFSKKGLIAPVIMTLANRSAWGANACVGSGFQSYSDAVQDRRTLSHAAANPDGISPYANWKTPAEWGGADGHKSWPFQSSATNRIVPVRPKNNPRRFERWDLNQQGVANWAGNATLSDAKSNWAIAFLSQLLGITSNVTIYSQLQSSTTDLLAYQIATEMNLLVYPVTVQTPDFSLFDLPDFEVFYSNCL